MYLIKVSNLTKAYGEFKAVDDVSFEVNEGEIFGIIGENGAGKTTTCECIEGIRVPTSGEITINGINPNIRENKAKISKLIGVQLQETRYPKRMKVKEVCDLFCSFYDDVINFDELLAEFNIYELRNQYIESLSGGQKQRLAIILALIHKPKVVFLDELTTGLDPRTRRNIWDAILKLKENGTTVVMTTHFMDEAEYLCDRVAVFKDGKIVALDTVHNLIDELPYKEKVSFFVKNNFNLRLLEGPLTSYVTKKGKEVTVYGDKGVSDTVRTIIDTSNCDYLRYRSSLPTLEDVFLEATEEGERI